MKRIKIISFLTAFILCSVFYSYAQKVKGNKNVVTQDRKVSPFTQLEISEVANVTILQGATESVRITTDENIQQYYVARNEGNKLIIETTRGNLGLTSSGLDIEITVKN